MSAEAEYLFVVGKNYEDNQLLKEIPHENIIVKKMLTSLIGWRLWYDHQLPSLLKKSGADLLITTGGIASSSPIAQCIWISGLFENNNSKKAKTYFNFYKKRLVKTIERSKTIFMTSEKARQNIIDQNKANEEKVIGVTSWANEEVKLLSWAEKESIKTKYAAGKEYFAVDADNNQDDFIDLLKAFSLFKKRQQSNMQFVFAGDGRKNNIDFIEKLETFKYRSDVHVYNSISKSETLKIVSASYVFIHPFIEDEVGSVVLNAFKANVPVIISEKSDLHEIAADAALYADVNNIESLSAQLILLYKNEKLRSGLIEKGELKWQKFTRNRTIDKLHEAILQAVKKNKNNSV